MKIVERIAKDKEIQELKKQLYNLTGQCLPWHYDCYLDIEDYKAHLRDCIKAGKIIVRSQDEKVMHRFDSILKNDTTSQQ